MNAETLKELIHADDFQPFQLHLADGRALEVPHPDFITLSRTGRTAVVALEGERFAYVDVMLVVDATVGRDTSAAP